MNSVLRFEIDQAVSGLGLYIDRKLEEVDKKLNRVYKNVGAVIKTADTETKLTAFKPGQLGPPAFRRKRR